MPETYGSDYFASHCGAPYRRGDGEWETFFGRVADEIVRVLNPRTVFDAGCAIGFLVEALRARGVDAHGIDLSEYAIGEAPAELQPFLRVATVDEELEGRYDAVVCIEVLEHVPPPIAAEAIANFARHTDAVLFSSTPGDFDEPTHVNVRPTSEWIELFAAHGLLPDPTVDATFLTAHSLLFRRSDPVAFAVAADAALREERRRAKALAKRVKRLEQTTSLRNRVRRRLSL